MAQPLHPNLARIAVAYDDIFSQWESGRIDAAEAHRRIIALVARDDDGVLWTINPTTGAWMRRTLDGQTVEATPPAYGYATPTPHDLSDSDIDNPDRRITFRQIDDEAMYAPSHLTGLTRRPPVQLPASPSVLWKWAAIILAVIACVIIIAHAL
jgi:hypothetical protein